MKLPIIDAQSCRQTLSTKKTIPLEREEEEEKKRNERYIHTHGGKRSFQVVLVYNRGPSGWPSRVARRVSISRERRVRRSFVRSFARSLGFRFNHPPLASTRSVWYRHYAAWRNACALDFPRSSSDEILLGNGSETRSRGGVGGERNRFFSLDALPTPPAFPNPRRRFLISLHSLIQPAFISPRSMRCKLALRCEFSFHDRLNLFPSSSSPFRFSLSSFLPFPFPLPFFSLRLRDDEKRTPTVVRRLKNIEFEEADETTVGNSRCSQWSWEGKKRECFYFRRVRGNRDFFFETRRRLFVISRVFSKAGVSLF